MKGTRSGKVQATDAAASDITSSLHEAFFTVGRFKENPLAKVLASPPSREFVLRDGE